MNFAPYIDHTILKADAVESDLIKICDEACKYSFASVCINPANVSFVADRLKKSSVKVCCVIGFPLGANTTETKVFETADAISKGASEIDMVINIGALRDKRYDYVKNEIQLIKGACSSVILKVIIETCYLSDNEKQKVCQLALEAGADFVKTSTGFGTGGATEADVSLMKGIVGSNAKVKASGGVRDAEVAEKFIRLGADRLGTSSGVAIVSGESGKSNY